MNYARQTPSSCGRRPVRLRPRVATGNPPLTTRNSRHGFTLIELLLVLIILAILAGVVVKNFTGVSENARKTAAKSDIETYRSALVTYEAQVGKFPSSEEGLQALVTKPADVDQEAWKHQYIETIKKDPWGHDYIYRCPGNNGKDFDILSGGSDGHEGGGDDISN